MANDYNTLGDAEKQPLLLQCATCVERKKARGKLYWIPNILIALIYFFWWGYNSRECGVNPTSSQSANLQTIETCRSSQPILPWNGTQIYHLPQDNHGLVIRQEGHHSLRIASRGNVKVKETDIVGDPTVTFDIKVPSEEWQNQVQISSIERDGVYYLTVGGKHQEGHYEHPVCITLDILVQLPTNTELDIFEVQVSYSDVVFSDGALQFDDTLSLSTAAGDITLEGGHTANRLSLSTSSGNVIARLPEARTLVSATTASGNVQVTVVDKVDTSASIALSTSAGNTALSLPESADSRFDVSTTVGHIDIQAQDPGKLHFDRRFSHTASGYYGSEEASAQVLLKTAVGYVRLVYGESKH